MSLKKSEKMLVGALACVASIYLFDMFVLSSDEEEVPKKGKKIERIEKKSTSPIADAKKNFDSFFNPDLKKVLIEQKVDPSLLSEWQRDPFIGAFTPDILDSMQQKDVGAFILTAISWRDNVAYVIIDDDVYKLGESKNGIHVLNVSDDEVTVSFEGKKSILKLDI